MSPPRNFKRKSSGKFSRNLQASAEFTRTDYKGTGSKSDDVTLSLSVKSANIKSGSEEMVIPNRVYVGGITDSTTEWDIQTIFGRYGNIKTIRILRDANGISRGYGFVTFATEDQARSILKERDVIIKGKKVKVAPALKKKNYHPVTPLRSTTEMKLSTTVEKFAGSYIYEQATRNKGFDEKMCKFNYNLTLEYSGNEVVQTQLPLENTRTYMDSGMFFSEPNMQYQDYGSSQMNYLSYPAWVYIPEQTYPGSSIGYPMNGNFLEMVQVVPAPLCGAPTQW